MKGTGWKCLKNVRSEIQDSLNRSRRKNWELVNRSGDNVNSKTSCGLWSCRISKSRAISGFNRGFLAD